MNYITITFDLTEDDFMSNKVEELEKFLEDKGFLFESDAGEAPSTTLLKQAAGDEDIDAILDEVIEFCEDKEIGLVNLIVTGAAPVAHYVSPHWEEDHDHEHDEDEEEDDDEEEKK